MTLACQLAMVVLLAAGAVGAGVPASAPLLPQQGQPAAPPSGPAVVSNHLQRNPHQHHSGDWLRKYKNMPPEQQQKALQSDPDFRRLPPDRQQKLQQRLQHFNTLPPQKQNAILDRMEIWEHLTSAQKQEAKSVYARIRQLPPDRRNQLVSGIHDLRQMDPQERQQFVNSEKFRSTYNDQERSILKTVLDLPLRPIPRQETAPATETAPQP